MKQVKIDEHMKQTISAVVVEIMEADSPRVESVRRLLEILVKETERECRHRAFELIQADACLIMNMRYPSKEKQNA